MSQPRRVAASERVRRLPLGAGIALGFAAGLASFTVVAVLLAAAGSHAVAVVLGVVLVAAIIAAAVLETGRPARIDDYEYASGELAATLRDLGFRSSVGAPIVVDGRLWGVVIASSKDEQPLPPDSEARIEEFTDGNGDYSG